MTTYTIEMIIRVLVALGLATLLGNGAVYMFNRLPSGWFADYKDDSSEEKVIPEKLLRSIDEGRQRITSNPWKVVFTGFFGVSGVYLAVTDSLSYEIASMLVLAIVLEMAIADVLYRVVPDQFSILLAISSVGFATFRENWWEPAAGAALAALLMLATWGLGRLIYRKDAIGGADIKFFIALGCVTGRSGTIAIFILTAIFNGAWALWIRLVQRRNIESLPMIPPAFIATAIYILFLWSRVELLSL